ncbi:MAG: phosphopantothenoylcysteine decarboxylase, partial [Treponema sp.]|nr:phosphopantothenoylcysteine decarboxylase [Treponema sp.]
MKQTDSHILITGGGCREAIDGVRFVTNMSTGRTSAFLADTLAASGASVTAVMGQGAILPERPDVRILRFESGADLSAQVQAELEEAHRAGNDYTAVIHAAAVSDFIPETVTTGGVTYAAGKHLKKLHSGDEMTVTFRAAPKIADSIRTWAGEHTLLFCFKLT